MIFPASCDCVCPGCRAQLEAVNSENPFWKKHPHFRHHNLPESVACEVAAVTKAAKQALSEAQEFQLPGHMAVGEARSADGKLFTHRIDQPGPILAVTQYTSVDATDAILTLADGQMIYVRLIATGIPIEGEQPKQTKFAEVIIDISDPVLRTANREVLRQHISLTPEQRLWCTNQDVGALQAQANAAAQSLANAYIRLSEDPREKLKALRAGFFENAGKTDALKATKRQDGQSQLEKIRAFYNDGAYRHYAPKIMFDEVIEEARKAQEDGRSVGQLFGLWNERYKLKNDLHPIAQVLGAAGFRTAIGEWHEWNSRLRPKV